MVSETVCINIYRKKPNSIILGNVTCTNSSTTSWLQLLHQNNQFGFNEEHYEIQGLLHRRRGSAEGIVKSELSCMISKTLEKWKHISWTKVYKVHLVMKVGGTPTARPMTRELPQVVAQIERVRVELPTIMEVEPTPSCSRQAAGDENRGLMGRQVVNYFNKHVLGPSSPSPRVCETRKRFVFPSIEEFKRGRITPESREIIMRMTMEEMAQGAEETVRRELQVFQPRPVRRPMGSMAQQFQTPPQVALTQHQTQAWTYQERALGGEPSIIFRAQSQLGFNSNPTQYGQVVYNQTHVNSQFIQGAQHTRRYFVTSPSPVVSAVRDFRPTRNKTSNHWDPVNASAFFSGNNRRL